MGGPHRRNRFCCNKCQGAAFSEATIGNKRETANGYVLVHLPAHPCANSGGNVLEHRLVMEKHLGRLLAADETVHHINGKRNDNRVDNLELWVSFHPPGQRVPDIVEWALAVVARYSPNYLTKRSLNLIVSSVPVRESTRK